VDADTDQIIFGAHQIAYRAVTRRRFPAQITREFTFSVPQIAEFSIAPRRARHRGVYVRTVRATIGSSRSSST